MDRRTGRTTRALQDAIRHLAASGDAHAVLVVLNRVHRDYVVRLADSLGLPMKYDRRTHALSFDGRELRLKSAETMHIDSMHGSTAKIFVDHAVWESAPLRFRDELKHMIACAEVAAEQRAAKHGQAPNVVR